MIQLKSATLLALFLTAAGGVPSTAVANESAASEQSTPARFQKVRAMIDRLMREDGVPSVVVSVAKDGKILWEEGFGWADRENRVPATPHVPYSLASVSKAITATGIMMLNERGKLDLDAPVENFLGHVELEGYAGDPDAVTIRRTLSHMGGLPSYFQPRYTTDPQTAEEVLTKFGMVIFPPGKQFHYSNVGYRALDTTLAHVSGKTYGEFLRKKIFLPLGMANSDLGPNPTWPAAAARYDNKLNRIGNYWSIPGAGDVWASAHDLMRFGAFHVGAPLPDQKSILRPETVRQMRVNATSGVPIEWGLGWHLDKFGTHRVVAHGGAMAGAAANLVTIPDEKLVIAILSNQNSSKVRDLWKDIASSVLPDAEKGEGGPQFKLGSVTATGTWEGSVVNYDETEPFKLIFQPDGDIHAKIGQRMTSLVNNVGMFGDTLIGRFYGTMRIPEAGKTKQVLYLTLKQKGDEMVGELKAESAVDPTEFEVPSFVRLKRQPAAEPAQ